MKNSLALLLAALVGCSGSHAGPNTLEGSATLAGLTHHAGLSVALEKAGVAVAQTSTDDAGHWSLENLDKGIYEVRVTAPSTLEETNVVEVLVDGPSFAPDVTFTALGTIVWEVPTSGVVCENTGLKLDHGGARSPVDGAVTAVTTVGPHVVEAAVAELVGDPITVEVVYNTVTYVTALVVPHGTAQIAAQISVIEATTVPPVAVSVDGPCTTQAVTDANGAVLVEGLMAGDYALRFAGPPSTMTRDDHGPWLRNEATPCVGYATVADGWLANTTCLWRGVGTVTGRVTIGGAETGNGNIEVGTSAWGKVSTTKTDDAGYYSLDVISGTAPATIGVSRSDVSSATVDVVVPYNEVTEVPDITLAP